MFRDLRAETTLSSNPAILTPSLVITKTLDALLESSSPALTVVPQPKTTELVY